MSEILDSQTIKKECFDLYDQIHRAKIRLDELREICKHKNTHIGNYSYRIGVVDKTIICSDCGKPLKSLNNE